MCVPRVPAITRFGCIMFVIRICTAALEDALSVASVYTFATTDGIFKGVA